MIPWPTRPPPSAAGRSTTPWPNTSSRLTRSCRTARSGRSSSQTTRGDRALLDSLRRPDGWFTVGLVLLICATLAWSLDDALLVLGRDELTDFLFWAAIGGAVAGLLGPLVGWSRWTTHLIGAVFAALLVPLLVGWALVPEGANPGILFQRTTDTVVGAWSDLIVAQLLFTPEYGTTCSCWA